MKLSALLKDINVLKLSGDKNSEVADICYDSRKLKRGDLFVAMTGEKSDGHLYIRDAVENGAAAVVYEKEKYVTAFISDKSSGVAPDTASGRGDGEDISFVRVGDARAALALIANNYYGSPSRSLSVIGITGTNGKTTVSYLVKSVLESWGKKVGLIGTIRYMIDKESFDAPHTTPEAPEFQELLARMRQAGCSHVVTEVSSHALAQKRVDGTIFRSLVFTNLTREHLDFHLTMDNYYEAKRRLFTELSDADCGSVINIDDVFGRKLAAELAADGRSVITCGFEAGSDLMATDINNSSQGLRFCISARGSRYDIVSPLTGLPNIYNILSAAGACRALGVPWSTILSGLRTAGPVSGRFEKVEVGQSFLAVIDYAHTEDALERLIYTARGLSAGKIITVFGCGGDRDRGKRPVMGSIATRLSDFVIITSDNPRSERPEDIIKEIESGAVRKNYLIEPDRREAIKRAVLMAGENDIVLVAGKGHENYQEIRGQKMVFSDREVLQEAIRQLIKNN